MFFEDLLQCQLIYQCLFAILFVVFLNKLLSGRMRDSNVPLVPRVVYVRNQTNFQTSSPVIFETIKEFLADLQQKRNAILLGIFKFSLW